MKLLYAIRMTDNLSLVFEAMSKASPALSPISDNFFVGFCFVCGMRDISIGSEPRSIVFTSGKMRLLTTSLMKSDFVGILFVGGH